MPLSQVQTAMDVARGMHDSTWLGRYDLAAGEWDTPVHVDEPPYPDWFTQDWRRWEKYGLYVNPESPLQLLCHPRGDSLIVFEFKLPKARLLQFLGIDTTQQTEFPRVVAYLNDTAITSVTDSGASIILQALPGLVWSHHRNNDGDTLTLSLGIDWQRLKDSVQVWATGGSGASTFLELTDTPASYSGKAGQVPIVNPGGTALEFGPMSASGTLSNAVIVWDTTGVAIDSTCTVWRMEWTPPIELRHRPSVIDTSEAVQHARVGVVRYRLYLSTPEVTRRSVGYMAWLMTIVFDSTNGCWPIGMHYNSFTFEGALGNALNATTYSLGVPVPNGGGLPAYVQYGYSTASVYRAINIKGATEFPGSNLMLNGRPAWYWLNYWITNASATSNSFAGWIDLYITYGQDHGTNSTWGAKIQSIYWRQQTE